MRARGDDGGRTSRNVRSFRNVRTLRNVCNKQTVRTSRTLRQRPFALAGAIAFAVLAVAVAAVASTAAASPGGAGGPAVAVSPDPPLPGEPLAVRVTGLDAGNVANASLRTCLAEEGQIVFCLLPVPMRVVDGALVAESRQGFGAGEEVGVAVEIKHQDGSRTHLPPEGDDPDNAYYFYRVAGAPPGSDVPAPASAGVAAAGGLAAVAFGRRRRA